MIKTPKELFIQMLSKTWSSTDRISKAYQELAQAAQDPEIKEALEARAWVTNKDAAALEQCFKLIGEKPVQVESKLQETLIEDFRREIGEIQTPVAKTLFVMAKANHLNHLRMAAFEVMIAMADRSGHHGVGVLLESCLADKIAFSERNRRGLRRFVETRIAEKLAA